MSNVVHPFKVGQIFYNSWGYDQTNIDFYQVVEIKPKSIVVRQIANKVQVEGYFQGRAFPVPGQFNSRPLLKKVQARWNPGSDQWEHAIKMEHGVTYLLNPIEAEKGLYCSYGH